MAGVWYCFNCGYEVRSRGRCHQCREKLLASPLPELAPGDETDEVGYRLAGWDDGVRGRLIHSLVRKGVVHRFEADELVVAVTDEEQVDELVDRAAETAEPLDDEADDEERVIRTGDSLGRQAGGDLSPAPYPGDPTAPRSSSGRAGLTGHAGYLGDTYLEDLDPDAADHRTAGGALASDRDRAAPMTVGELRVVSDQIQRLHAAAGRLQADPTDMEADGDVAEASAAVFVTDHFAGMNADTWAAVGRTTRRLLGALGAEDAQEDEIGRQAGILGVLLDDIADTVARGADHPADTELTEAGEARDEAEDSDEAQDRDETVYELPDWLPEQRAELTVLLKGAGIAAAWDDGDLVVPVQREAEVEALFDGIHGVANTEAEDEAQYHQIEELFAATSRLAGDPDDPARAADFLRAVPAVEGTTPLGFDGMKWSVIRKRSRVLADSIEHKANPDVVLTEASTLRDLLRALV